jgi:hypothetical protein
VPLLAYRVYEELNQVSNLEILGPVETADAALQLARCGHSPIVICDDALAGPLLPTLALMGCRVIRISTEIEPVAAGRYDMAVIRVQIPTWPDQLRALIRLPVPQAPILEARAEPWTAFLPAVSLPERRQHSMRQLSTLRDADWQHVATEEHDPETGLPGGATFSIALDGLPRVGVPTLVLFIDLATAVDKGSTDRTWVVEAGKRLRQTLRRDDLVFRLDPTLYAVLAVCLRNIYVPALRERVRWMLCGTDFIAPEHIVIGDAYWTGGRTANQVVTAAWQELQLSRMRVAHPPEVAEPSAT